MKGMTSICFLRKGIVEKEYFTHEITCKNRAIHSHWEREVNALLKLTGEPHFPELIGLDKNIIKMTYCGERLTEENRPEDWKEQCVEIRDTQDRLRIFHLDIKQENITVKKGIIHLIDWGMWSITPLEKTILNGINWLKL